jgi:RecB family exonuclease
VDFLKLMGLFKSIPKEKLKTDSGLKEVFRELGKKTGKSFTEQELNSYVTQFRKMARTESKSSLLNKLAQQGVNPSDLNSIKNRFKK